MRLWRCSALIGQRPQQKLLPPVGNGSFGEKAAKLSTAAAWNRQTENIKDVINQVASILDEKHVHWTIRVGVTIGRSVPTGQLREFLGDQVTTALWR